MTNEKDILYENKGHYITLHRGAFYVWKYTYGSGSMSDSAYHNTADGLSLAKARVDYLAKTLPHDCKSWQAYTGPA